MRKHHALALLAMLVISVAPQELAGVAGLLYLTGAVGFVSTLFHNRQPGGFLLRHKTKEM